MMDRATIRGWGRCDETKRRFRGKPTLTRWALWLLVAALYVLPSPQKAMGGDLLAIEAFTGNLFSIDLSTGAGTLQMSGGGDNFGGIACNEYGTLYTVTSSPVETQLYTVWTSWSPASPVGWTSVSGVEGALTFHPTSGMLYGRGGAAGEDPTLVVVNPDTGIGTEIGPMGLGPDSDICGMDFLRDGTLLGHDIRQGLPNRLVSIDVTTGEATVIGPTGDIGAGIDLGGLAVDPDTDEVYISNGSELFIANPTTGAATLIGGHFTPAAIGGLTFKRKPRMLGLELDSPISVLWDVDPTTGFSSNPRELDAKGLGALAQAPTGELYALQHIETGFFWGIDAEAGVATLIGPTGLKIIEGGLDFDPTTGILYGVNGRISSDDTPGLFSVNVTTGVATKIGAITEEDGTGIDASALAFDSEGNLHVLRTLATPEIWQIDPSDASVISVVSVPGLASVVIGGMEFDDASGALFVTASGVLYQVDPETGDSELIAAQDASSALEIVCPIGESPPGFSSAAKLKAGLFSRRRPRE